MKPFDLEAAKAGAPVCTRDGQDVRIICYDRDYRNYEVTKKIVALVNTGSGEEITSYYQDGKIQLDCDHPLDLMMKTGDEDMYTVKKEKWIIMDDLYMDPYRLTNLPVFFDTKEIAEKFVKDHKLEDPVIIAHLDWEE